MEKEYHDPDYPETSPVKLNPVPNITSDVEKIMKIKTIIRREFSKELELRENEMNTLDQKLVSARHLMSRLRYTVVNRYYNQDKLMATTSELYQVGTASGSGVRNEVASLLRNGQQNIHPSLKKILGKDTIDLEEIFTYKRRNRVRRDYSEMLKSKNTTIPEDSTKSLRPSIEPVNVKMEPEDIVEPPKKIPRRLEPKIENVFTLNEAKRNKIKDKYRIIIGNTSKYAPPASQADKSTHKWLLYIRGPPSNPDLTHVVTSVKVYLHQSYSPHHVVSLSKPPFHVSRRGWGEFPAKIELNFPDPDRNRPATVEHTIKLDRNYTGLQTLGSETVIDVWLSSTQEMYKYIYKDFENVAEPVDTIIKSEKTEKWFDFLIDDKTFNVDEMLIKNSDKPIPPTESIKPTSPDKKLMKYVDQSGKIYYLELEKSIDPNKIKEVEVKVNGAKNGVKREAKKSLSLVQTDPLTDFSHIYNDHCYTQAQDVKIDCRTEIDLSRLIDIKMAVNYLLKKIPLISKDESFIKAYPFVVASERKFWSLDFAKRRNIEWSRAKLINGILKERFKDKPIWRTKQILLYSRYHGYNVVRTDSADLDWCQTEHSNIKSLYSKASDVNTLSLVDLKDFELEGRSKNLDLSDLEVDVLSDKTVQIKNEPEESQDLEVIEPSQEERLRFMFIEKVCSDIGIELRNEDVGGGFSYSAVHAVLLSAMKQFADEVIRSSLAHKVTNSRGDGKTPVWSSTDDTVRPIIKIEDVFRGVQTDRLSVLTSQGLGAKEVQTYKL